MKKPISEKYVAKNPIIVTMFIFLFASEGKFVCDISGTGSLVLSASVLSVSFCFSASASAKLTTVVRKRLLI